MSIFQLFQVKNIEQHQTLESWTLGTRGNLLRKVLQPNMIHCKTQSIISKFHQLNIINDSINNSYLFNVHRVLEVTLRIRPYTLLVSFQQMPRLLADSDHYGFGQLHDAPFAMFRSFASTLDQICSCFLVCVGWSVDWCFCGLVSSLIEGLLNFDKMLNVGTGFDVLRFVISIW